MTTEEHSGKKNNNEKLIRPFAKYQSPFKDAPPIPCRAELHRRFGGVLYEYDFLTEYSFTMQEAAQRIAGAYKVDEICAKNAKLRDLGIDVSGLKSKKVYSNIDAVISDASSGGF